MSEAHGEAGVTAGSESVTLEPGFDAFRAVALDLLARDVSPRAVHFCPPGQGSLFDALAGDPAPTSSTPRVRPRVPREFAQVARRVAHHRSLERGALLYRVLHRLTHGEPQLLRIATDADVLRLGQLDAQVRRSAHKTKAFVRFREVQAEDGAHFVAWHAPEHPILPLVADFFAERFNDMRWHILTPDQSLRFDGKAWSLGAGVPRSEAPTGDAMEDLWRTYYRAIFNPARVMTKAMHAEMPKRHWRTLPETADIPKLLAEAPKRVRHMLAQAESMPTAEALIQAAGDLPSLAESAGACAACPMRTGRDGSVERSARTVFGVGPSDAAIVLVGEQPGDEEDRAGTPFVGPAGKLLDEALAAAQLDRDALYLTNAVKHFHYQPRGNKKRLHHKPGTGAVRACRPWLIAELERITPQIVVLLGATAARSLLGAEVRVERDRGKPERTPWGTVLVTYHPSALLRAKSEAEAVQLREHLHADLALARRMSREPDP